MEIKELESKLGEILTQIKESKATAEAEQKKFGTMLSETVEKLTALQKQADALDVKIAERHAAAEPEDSVFEFLSEHDGLKKHLRDRPSHSFVLELTGKQTRQFWERKTTIDSAAVGSSTSGVLRIDRTQGIVPEARQRLNMRSILSARPTTLPICDYIKVNSAPARASMQTESSAKVENAVTFTTASQRVQTIATWIPASKQVIDDMPELLGYLQTALPFYVDLAEEVQFLTGSNTGNDLNGLVTQGTAFNTALNSYTPGWKKGDIIARAVQQIEIAKEVGATFVALHPTDYWDIRLTKDTTGQFIDKEGLFWGLQPIRTTCLGSGNFLVGSGDPAAVEIRDRMGMTLEIALQHSDYWTKNMIAIRAEKRVALICYRSGSFITGTFNTSP